DAEDIIKIIAIDIREDKSSGKIKMDMDIFILLKVDDNLLTDIKNKFAKETYNINFLLMHDINNEYEYDYYLIWNISTSLKKYTKKRLNDHYNNVTIL
ncbi:MAG: hypothetical protein MUO21_02090, partial [Nitrososphaeraceae archaeon]|nr:hypothetical protein [Nitrososphaeraceae archaeon]